jgi:hypothetical protein
MVIYYIKSLHNPDKHPLIPDDFPWYTSRNPIENGIEIEEADYRILEASFDLTAYNNSLLPDPVATEAELSLKQASYKGAGTLIADELERKVWARNTRLMSEGVTMSTTQLQSLLQISLGINSALKSGSLKTAKDGINQMRLVFPQYADIADWAVSSIEVFL